MTAPDLVAALLPVIEALDSLGVRYYVGGSVASSIHGVPRASIDADLIAELGAEHVAPLAARLSALFYLDEGRMRDAVERRLSFNVIHLATMFKVDVFVSKGRPFDVEASGRARLEALGDSPDAPKPGSPRPRTRSSPSSSGIAVAASPPSASGPTFWVCCESGPAASTSPTSRTGPGALGVADLLERASRQAG